MRVRLTTHMPLSRERIGLTLWWGSIERGWNGKPVAPWRWNWSYRVSRFPEGPGLEMQQGL